MELSWSTFLLEIINFVILVWILKRFFYAPVRRVIDQRRKAIEESMAQAEQKRAEARTLEEQYQARLSHWEQEKKQAREQLESEIAAERARMMDNLKGEVEKAGEKARVLNERHLEDFKHQVEQQALSQATVFAARILGRTADQGVQDRLFDILINELPKVPAEDRSAIQGDTEGAKPIVKVTSAYPINEEQRTTLEKVLSGLGEAGVACEYHTDPALIAGFRINAGALVLRANLQDELQFFSEAAHGRPD